MTTEKQYDRRKPQAVNKKKIWRESDEGAEEKTYQRQEEKGLWCEWKQKKKKHHTQKEKNPFTTRQQSQQPPVATQTEIEESFVQISYEGLFAF